MAENEKLEGLHLDAEEGFETEDFEGLRAEDLDALAGEFTLDDLAEFDEEFEFDVSDLESIKPEYTLKEKLKMILMSNTAFSIVKWCFAGLGLIGLVLYIMAMVSPAISESLSTSVASGVTGVLTAISNVLPFSLLEVLAIVALVGILAYAGFLVYQTIKTVKTNKDGYKIAGIWVQFGYVLVAVFGTAFLFYSMCYGVTTNRTPFHYQSKEIYNTYKPDYYTQSALDGTMIYTIDQINEVAVNGMYNIYFTPTGGACYAGAGDSLNEIGEAVNACYKEASKDYPFLKGSEVKVKKLLFAPLYSAMGIGSIYSPFTGEVLINTDYPQVALPMQVARSIAKHRGFTNDGEASIIAYLVCTDYADEIDGDYNADFIKYAAEFDAYLEVGSLAYRLSKEVHLYCASALKESAKKNVIAYVKDLDTLYDNISKLEFTAASEKTPTDDYKILAKLLYVDFMKKEPNLDLKFNGPKDPVKAVGEKYLYSRYLVANFAKNELVNGWEEEVQEVWEEYNPAPQANDGSGE